MSRIKLNVFLVPVLSLAFATTSLASSTSAQAIEKRIASIFSERTYPSAGAALGISVKLDAVTLRPVSGANPAVIVEDTLSKLGVHPIVNTEVLRDTGATMVMWDGELDLKALRAVALALNEDARVRQVWPVPERNGSFVGTADTLIVTSVPGELTRAKEELQKIDGIIFVRDAGVPNTALYRAGEKFGHDAIAAANHIKTSSLVAVEPELFRKYVPYATVSDPLYSSQWHLSRDAASTIPGNGQVFVEDAWEITYGDPDVIVAVFDSGIEIGHEDLVANMVAGFDGVSNDGDPSPECSNSPDGNGEASVCPGQYLESHGTAVSGVIGAARENAIGGVGVCPDCSIYPVRYLGTGMGSVLSFAQAVTKAVDDGVAIINNSWGPGADTYFPLGQSGQDAFTYARTVGRDGLGTLLLFASGNDTGDVSTNPYASHPYAMAIGASTTIDDWAVYSNYGAEVDVVAPSQGGFVAEDNFGIITTDITGVDGYSNTNYAPEFGGTSAACPVAAGVAGLILSANPMLTAEQVRVIMTSTADKLTPVIDWSQAFGQDVSALFEIDENGHSLAYGWGRTNAAAAVALAANPPAQGGPCLDSCASCAADNTCEDACATQSDCLDGTICSEGSCSFPAPGPTSIGQVCSADCPYCVETISADLTLVSICSDECDDETPCPTGFTCRRLNDGETQICAIGPDNAGRRNYYRQCFRGVVVKDTADKAYCSQNCFSDSDGACPYGFACRSVSCECSIQTNFGCLQAECEESANPNSAPVCVVADDFGVGCESDFDCGEGDFCTQAGTCRVDDRLGCDNFCSTCSSNEDCDFGGTCIQGQADSTPWCSHGCETDRDCPGDSVCSEYDRGQGPNLKTCRAPGDLPNTQGCDPDYTCAAVCTENAECGPGQYCDTEGACIDGEEPEPTAEPEAEPENEPSSSTDDEPAEGFFNVGGGGCGCGSVSGVSSALGFAAFLLLLPNRRRRLKR